MSTPISVSYRLQAYGIHAFAGFFAAACIYKLAKAAQDYFFPNEKRKIALGLGFAAGIATSLLIASSPLAQNLVTRALMDAVAVGGPVVTNAKDEALLQLFLDQVGPQFSSLSSVFCGVAGTALSCWVFHKLY
jgi:hypothetical protein